MGLVRVARPSRSRAALAQKIQKHVQAARYPAKWAMRSGDVPCNCGVLIEFCIQTQGPSHVNDTCACSVQAIFLICNT